MKKKSGKNQEINKKQKTKNQYLKITQEFSGKNQEIKNQKNQKTTIRNYSGFWIFLRISVTMTFFLTIVINISLLQRQKVSLKNCVIHKILLSKCNKYA